MAVNASEASTWHRVLEEHEDGINHMRSNFPKAFATAKGLPGFAELHWIWELKKKIENSQIH